MTSRNGFRRLVLLGATVAIFAGVVAVAATRRAGSPDEKPTDAKADNKTGDRSWALWGGSVQRNLVNLTEKNIAADWVIPKSREDKGKNIKWWVPLGSKAYGGPIVAGGKIFVGTNNNFPRNKEIRGDKGVLMCFSEADGAFLWQSVHDKLPGGRAFDWPDEGICSGPVVEGKRLYYVSNRCEVICASTEGLAAGNLGVKDETYKSKTDADIIWRLDMIKSLGVAPHNLATCSPLIVGNTLFVITSNGVDLNHLRITAPNAPSFLAVDKRDGKVLWSDKSPGKNIMHGQWSNPVYAEPDGKPQIIFPGGDGWIYAFTPDKGELIWKFDCNPKKSKYMLGAGATRNDFVSTPIVADNKLYIAVGQDPEHKKGVGHMWCIDITKKPKNKDKDLSPVNDNFDPKAAVNKDSGLVWHYGGFDPDEEAPRPYFFGRSLSTCAVDSGLCYACDFDGFLFCFDAKTGKKHWEHELGGDTWCSPTIIDGKVYIGNEKSEMHIFKLDKEKKLIRKVKMGGNSKVRATPIAVNGVLYVMTENPCRLYAIQEK
jgi:outer membrane protein assembly factor BamB